MTRDTETDGPARFTLYENGVSCADPHGPDRTGTPETDEESAGDGGSELDLDPEKIDRARREAERTNEVLGL